LRLSRRTAVRGSPPPQKPSEPPSRELEAVINKAVGRRIVGNTVRIFAAIDISCIAFKPPSSNSLSEFPRSSNSSLRSSPIRPLRLDYIFLLGIAVIIINPASEYSLGDTKLFTSLVFGNTVRI
jgi:hypothetical protein